MLLDTQANHCTLLGALRRVRLRIDVGIGCAMAVEGRVLANEISIFSYVEVRGICTHTNFISEWFTNCICLSPSAAEICLQMSSACGFNGLRTGKNPSMGAISKSNILKSLFWIVHDPMQSKEKPVHNNIGHTVFIFLGRGDFKV